jgi:hypothetical protein
MINTGIEARRSTLSATLPSSTRRRPPRPCVDMTIRSIPSARAHLDLGHGIAPAHQHPAPDVLTQETALHTRQVAARAIRLVDAAVVDLVRSRGLKPADTSS